MLVKVVDAGAYAAAPAEAASAAAAATDATVEVCPVFLIVLKLATPEPISRALPSPLAVDPTPSSSDSSPLTDATKDPAGRLSRLL